MRHVVGRKAVWLVALAAAVASLIGASSALGATAAPGFAVSDWATGMANQGPNGVGPVGVAADPTSPNDIYVMNYASGTLYRYSAASGGVEGTAYQVSPAGLYGGNNAAGIAFDKDGKLYVALQASWQVAEISKTDGHIVRYLSGPNGYFYCATGIATDPLSGDLFVSSPCGWPIIRVPTSGSGGTMFGPAVDGITFGPDGTLWAEGGGNVYKIDGTNKASFGSSSVVAYVPSGDGISVAAASGNSSLPPYIFVNRNDGTITKVDLSGSSPAYSNIVTGGSRGDFSTVGYDGCLYATQTDRVIKVTNADGSCSLAPVTPDDATQLVISAPSSQDYNDAVTVSATLTDVSKGTVLSGQTVGFTLGTASCSGVTDGSGVASCSLTPADPAGSSTLTAHFDHQPKLAPATTTAPFTINLEQTTLAYNGVTGIVNPGSTQTLSGVLTEDGTTPIAGRTVDFALGTATCSGTTDATGLASCAVTVPSATGPVPVTASFAGDAYYVAASDSTTVLTEAPITAASVSVSATEGSVFSGAVATFTDPDPASTAAEYAATVDWGDGTTSTGVIGGTAGSFTVSGSHTYADQGSYTVTTTITDVDTVTNSATATGAATVADAPLAAGLVKATCGSGPCSVSFGFTDGNPGAGVSDYTATIGWGDSTTSTGTVAASGAGFVVTGTHAYADGGSGHAITVTVTDEGGSTVTATAPTAVASLLGLTTHEGDDQEGGSRFRVSFSCTSGTGTALLNGVAVTNGQIVRLKLEKKGPQRVSYAHGEHGKDGTLRISATSFLLVVSCTDGSGNQGCATDAPVFKTRSHDETRPEHLRDEHNGPGHSGGDR